MAVVKPFRGLRPKPESASRVAAPPYDVLSSDEARQLVKDNRDSFLRVNKSEVDFTKEESIYSDKVYLRGKENLNRLFDDGIMIRDDSPCFYLYRLTMNGQSQTGIVALTSVDEYDQGLIKKHEHTRPEKVSDRADHIMTLEAQVGPVFSIFRNNPTLKNIFSSLTANSPDVDFVADDGIRHELWVINDQQSLDKLIDGFEELPALYIADGHHRSEAASEVRKRMKENNSSHSGDEIYNYFLNVIFPDDELRILPYNRVVNKMNRFDIADIISQSEDNFEITVTDNPVEPNSNHSIGVYANNQWYSYKIKPGTYDNESPADSIDSAILTKNFLDPILGISDLRTDNRISFVGGIRGVKELVRLVNSDKYQIAFSMYSVAVEQLLAVADAGQVMPPKSTWFEPKLRSGMVVNLLKE